jgi:hypothetical protein
MVRIQEFVGQIMALVQVRKATACCCNAVASKTRPRYDKANIPSMDIRQILARSSDNSYELQS